MHVPICAGLVQIMQMDDPALDYVRHVLKVRGWKVADLAKAAGVSHSTINRPLTVPGWPMALSRRTIDAIHRASGIDPVNYAGEETPALALSADDGPALVNVYNVAASAGHGALVEWEEEAVQRLAFPPNYLRKITSANPANLAIIGVKGDSMLPTLSDNDVVMIDLTKRDLSFDGLFVLRDGGASLLVKRIGRGSRRGTVLLISDNRTYRDIERAIEDIEVVGKVVWRGVKE